jgi:hypothetical protein
MKYMLIMNSPRDGYTQYMSWPKELLAANAAFMQTFTEKLRAASEFVGAEGLASPEQALRVRAGKRGVPITDGVFPESKEFLAGYWIVKVGSRERAIEIAAEAATAPGAPITSSDGTQVEHLWIEVREIMGGHGDIS